MHMHMVKCIHHALRRLHGVIMAPTENAICKVKSIGGRVCRNCQLPSYEPALPVAVH